MPDLPTKDHDDFVKAVEAAAVIAMGQGVSYETLKELCDLALENADRIAAEPTKPPVPYDPNHH